MQVSLKLISLVKRPFHCKQIESLTRYMGSYGLDRYKWISWHNKGETSVGASLGGDP